jgi:hypothetical protein
MALCNRSKTLVATVLVTVVLSATLAGCGGGKSKTAASQTGLFNNQNQAKITCLAHQTQAPSVLYTGGANGADTAHILEMLQYYTANGDKTYCDSAKASAIDLDWAHLYVKLGGDATKVRTILGTA